MSQITNGLFHNLNGLAKDWMSTPILDLFDLIGFRHWFLNSLLCKLTPHFFDVCWYCSWPPWEGASADGIYLN